MTWILFLLLSVTVAEAGAPSVMVDLSRHLISPILAGGLIALALALGLLTAWRHRR